MMRTYTRKRPNFQQLENVLELCRLCLEKPSEAVPIYKSEDPFSPLALRIMFCVGLEVPNDKSLPNHICMDCHKELERYHDFRRKCESSYQKLKSHILAVKQIEMQQEDVIKKREFLGDSDWNEKQTLVFTLNFDGTIHVKDGNDSNTANDEPLITLKREILNEKEKELLEPIVETKQASKNLEHQINETNLMENCIAQVASNSEDCTSDEIKKENLATFLSSTLNALGIMTKNEDGTITLLSDTLTNVEVETGDGKEIIMELVVEDDVEDMEITSMESTVADTPQTGNGVEIDQLKDDNIPSNYFVWNNTEPMNGSIAVTLPNQLPPSAPDSTDKIQSFNVGSNCKSETETQKQLNLRGKRVPCLVCGKTFSSRTVLQRHTSAVHAKERPYQCAQCGKRFGQKEVWVRHLLVHQEKRPYQCDSCSKSFTQRGALSAHERLHAPPNARRLTLHQCPQCPKLFLHHSGLSRHMGVHLGKTWSCEACGRTFSDDSALRRHHRTCAHTLSTKHKPIASRTHTATGDG